MNRKFFASFLLPVLTLLTYISCDMPMKQKNNFKVQVDRFADIEILRYQVPGFEGLSLRQKKFVYFYLKHHCQVEILYMIRITDIILLLEKRFIILLKIIMETII